MFYIFIQVKLNLNEMTGVYGTLQTIASQNTQRKLFPAIKKQSNLNRKIRTNDRSIVTLVRIIYITLSISKVLSSIYTNK